MHNACLARGQLSYLLYVVCTSVHVFVIFHMQSISVINDKFNVPRWNLYIEYYSLSLLFLNCHLFKDNSTCQDYTGVQLTPLHGLDLVLLDFFLVSQGQILVLYKKVYMVKKLIHNSCKLTYIWNTSLAYLAFHGFHIYFNNCSLRV